MGVKCTTTPNRGYSNHAATHAHALMFDDGVSERKQVRLSGLSAAVLHVAIGCVKDVI